MDDPNLYINTPGIQIVMWTIISIVVAIIFMLFLRISKKKKRLINNVNNNLDFSYYKEFYLNKINDQDLSKKPKAIFFILEKSLPYFKENMTEKEYQFFVKEFEKVEPNNLTEEDVELMKKYYRKITI